jgi:NADH-quinone oxidoreductase subunit L
MPSYLTVLLASTLPLAAFWVAILFLRGRPRVASLFVVACGGVSFFLAALLWATGDSPENPTMVWFQSGDFQLHFGFFLDHTSRLFGMVVTFITFMIQVYSLAYMAKDPGKTRFFALLALFEWAMLSFVYAANLIQAFIGWELVGLASFLLIGFWYEKPAAAAAARKAFIMTRVGDVGLYIGLFMLLHAISNMALPAAVVAEVGQFDIQQIITSPAILAGLQDNPHITAITLLLFLGIMGKSAQFPLHTWLPDAMEGPTPVSALLHSATMVAAGVFLYARLFPVFGASDVTPTVVIAVALFTAVMSGTIAMVTRDIKRVLAYSSIGQLSFMLLGLAAGSLYAGVFHLTTHAFFKALLFLCAGAFFHHVGTTDLVVIGRQGGRKLKVATLGLIAGGAALAGIPPLAGFFSKEEVVGALASRGTLFVVIALFAAFITAYYTFRMIFLVVRPNPDAALEVEATPDAGHGHGGHGVPWLMAVPIVLLSLLAVVAGFFSGPIGETLRIETGEDHHAYGLLIATLSAALVGVGLAWIDFGRRGAPQVGFIARFPALKRLFENRWYVDQAYEKTVLAAVAGAARVLQKVEDGAFNPACDRGPGVVRSGREAAAIQQGYVQIHVGSSVVALALFIIWLGFERRRFASHGVNGMGLLSILLPRRRGRRGHRAHARRPTQGHQGDRRRLGPDYLPRRRLRLAVLRRPGALSVRGRHLVDSRDERPLPPGRGRPQCRHGGADRHRILHGRALDVGAAESREGVLRLHAALGHRRLRCLRLPRPVCVLFLL